MAILTYLPILILDGRQHQMQLAIELVLEEKMEQLQRLFMIIKILVML